MPRQLSTKELTSARECFAIYSDHHRLTLDNLSKALRSLGANPSNDDIRKIVAHMRLSDKLTFDDFLVRKTCISGIHFINIQK